MELSNTQKLSSTNPEELIKPVWSRQHGAYISLVTSWLIATLLSNALSLFHPAVLFLLLTGFNGAELLVDSVKRRSPQSYRKLLWMGIYGVAAIAMAYVLWIQSPMFQTMLPVFIAGGILFTFLSIKRLQKTIPTEIISFMLFSAAGLLALNPVQTPDAQFIFTLWVMLSAYFSLSVFHVKYRIKEITARPLIAYVVIAIIAVLLAGNFSVASLLVSTLLLFKTVPLLASPKAYRSLQIKHIGYLEMVLQGIFIIVIVLTFHRTHVISIF